MFPYNTTCSQITDLKDILNILLYCVLTIYKNLNCNLTQIIILYYYILKTYHMYFTVILGTVT